MMTFAKDTPYIQVMSSNDKTRAPYRKPAAVSQYSTTHFFSFSIIFLVFIFFLFYFLHTIRIIIILSCIPFMSILTYALPPMDGIGFFSNSDSYVILDIAFPCQGVKNLPLIIFFVSSYTQLVAM